MNNSQIVGLLLLPLGLAWACGDEDPADAPGQGGSSNSGAAGNSTASGSGSGASLGDSSAGGSSGADSSAAGSSGASGNDAGGSSGTNVGGMGGNGSSNVTAEDVCARGCVKTESLDCPNDPANCEATCLEDYLDAPAQCRALVLALGDCAADRPASDFVCDEDGESILRPGICASESIAVANCLLTAF